MFSSFFSTSAPVDPDASNFHSVAERYEDSKLFGALEPKDTEWLCAGGFITETQVFYTLARDGTSLMCQVIHSSVGLWYPTIQFTCRVYNAHTKETIWKSVNVTNFVTPPPNLDKRSSKADEYSITYKTTPGSDFPESYSINANLGTDLQISLDVRRPAQVPGFKVGNDPKGGYSYFGHDPEKADGYVIHRFWPRYEAKGIIVKNGAAEPIEGPGMFVHAIQGMRPNLVASAWNFAHFQSEEHGGTSVVQMEFTTTDAYGKKGSGSGGVRVNVGCVVIANKLATVSAETHYPGVDYPTDPSTKSRALHLNAALDAETGYSIPSTIRFICGGPSVVAGVTGQIQAQVDADVGTVSEPNGLIEKVDVLAEIPYVLKMAVNYVAGTKPYIYQWVNPGTLKVTGPDSLIAGLSRGLEVKGTVYNEATFIS